MWNSFTTEWLDSEAVGVVSAGEYEPNKLGEIGVLVADKLGVDSIPLTILPDIWISLSSALCSQLIRQRDDPSSIREEVVKWAANLARKDGRAEDEDARGWAEADLARALSSDDLRVVKVSAAELNPRYRGQRLVTSRAVRTALTHWALAYRASQLAEVS
jgi:hypothetical protein